MRIAIFTNTYKPTMSGVVSSIDIFRQGLIAEGHDVHIITPEYEDYEDKEAYVFRFPSLDLPERLDLSLVLPLKMPIAPTIRGIKPAVIHSQHPFVMGGLAAAFARDLRIPLVFTFHTRYDAYAQSYVPIAPTLAGMVAKEVVRRYVERCSHVIAPTPSIRDLIIREYTTDVPVTVVPTPINLEGYHSLDPRSIRARLGLEAAELLLYVGRLADEKNLSFLLRTFTTVVAARPQARLLLVGKGPQEHSLRQLVRRLGLGEVVIFAGSIPHSEVPLYAAAADLFVFPSLTDTQGLVLVEAMAAGTPVVAVEAPGPMDVLTRGRERGGVLVPHQKNAFASAVLELLADETRRLTLGAEAADVARQYSIPAATEQLIAVYEAAIELGPRPRRARGWEKGRRSNGRTK